MKDKINRRAGKGAQHQMMGKAIDWFDDLVHDKDKTARAAGAAAGVGAPPALVGAVGAAYGIGGGAAIMKTLAIAGTVVGGGAMAGIAVVGVGAVGVAWGVSKAVKTVRGDDDIDNLPPGATAVFPPDGPGSPPLAPGAIVDAEVVSDEKDESK